MKHHQKVARLKRKVKQAKKFSRIPFFDRESKRIAGECAAELRAKHPGLRGEVVSIFGQTARI